VEGAGQRQVTGRRREATITAGRTATAAKQAPETALELLLQMASGQPAAVGQSEQ